MALIITAVVVGCIIIYFAFSVVRHQRKYLELQKKNMIAEISAMEKERARIATDLHDELGPVMSVIKFQVDFARSSPRVEKEQLEKASEQLDDLIERLREVANDLMPSALYRKGLVVAVEEYIDKVESMGSMQISFTYSQELVITGSTAIHVYRALQEIIYNGIKHAQAARMDIHVEKKQGQLEILCRDNGRGFDMEQVTRRGKGMGLASLKNRTEILGGSITMESKPGKGTVIFLVIPIDNVNN